MVAYRKTTAAAAMTATRAKVAARLSSALARRRSWQLPIAGCHELGPWVVLDVLNGFGPGECTHPSGTIDILSARQDVKYHPEFTLSGLREDEDVFESLVHG